MATSQDRSQALLDACTLDNAVPKDKTAAKVIVHARPPLVVIKPVLGHTLHLLSQNSELSRLAQTTNQAIADSQSDRVA